MNRLCARPWLRWPLFRLALLLVMSSASPVATLAGEPSPWIKATQSQARLIDGGRDIGGDLLAGLEIRLAPGFITYWRNPGDAGVPPIFSFAGSTNVKSVSVRYPAPHSLDEAGAKAFGYEDDVIFPLLIEALDPEKLVGLVVALDYAACHEICLPAHAVLGLSMDGQPSPEAVQVRKALGAVPRRAAVGIGGPPTILAVTSGPSGGFTVTVRVHGAVSAATLFVEAPEGWAYEADPIVVVGDGRALFPVKRLDRPKDADRPAAPMVLTLVTPAGAIEVPVQLDAAATTP